MPPLSAYTPFESLLFFQSLAALDSRPTSFVSISDVLRNNPFIRQNGTFDAGRLAPEALEELYTTLMRDGETSADIISSLEPNGHHVESNGTNPKKRKITSPRPDGLVDKGMSHAAIIPDLVSHLYARYKEIVTREIRNEEARYKEIKDEIERLQKEERETPKEPVPTPVIQKPTPQAPEPKLEPEPEPMDVDAKEERPAQIQPKDANKPSIELVPGIDTKQYRVELQSKEEDIAKQSPISSPHPAPVEEQRVPAQPVVPPQGRPVSTQVQSQLPPPRPSQQQPSCRQLMPQTTPKPPQPQALNGKPAATPKQPPLAPRDTPVNQTPTNIPAVQKPMPPSATPVPGIGSVPAPPATPSQASQNTNAPAVSPAHQKPISTAKPAGKEGPPKTPATTAPRPPPQPSFQQWSLNPPPQTPRPASSQPIPEPSGQTTTGRPFPSHPPQPLPKPETKAAYQTPQPTTVPSTPQPISTVAQSPAPSGYGTGYETPAGAAQALLYSETRSVRPRLTIATPGNLTPWKKTPRLSIPVSPRSPERPRREDVSPISEKAPSLMGSREATPEEPVPPPRKRGRNEGKGSGRGRESELAGAEVDGKGGLKPKVEKQTGKGRDRSAASSRSRGRSVLSRDEESESVYPGKIKHEMPSTPAGISEAAEPEPRPSSGRKGTAASEDRPGRGRPKRKRGASEALEAEALPPEINHISRIDPNQSTSYVLCARNFPRTGAPIMNDVTTHKHASIFTKPLTERDAPGYRDLIYRPQDLKSIKSSIHQGSKAVAAATEAANTPAADGESPAPNAGTPSKNAVLMLQKTEDVIPPKGIVNSAQLEKELIRMFTNAVMFNPLPQRGFGPAFPMTSDSGSRESTQVPELDEGGIINDTIEMFEDVEQAVTRWRAAERTADELASKSILSLRRGSASDLNTDSADEVKG
ncbi:Bromodomain-containing protein [Aspergillus minisclerotigenes]|uniref:Bromodomain-containing protein n=1 Tax=Aspergillus minisclerotigenes TaxID=656917 RepID=A0A5N6JKT0_9EURO|nr:Bromodomain-containing protein [Aspergillus minisclerotigenes]